MAQKWWTEKDFEFGKHTGTRYTWPRDRMICFRTQEPDSKGRIERIIVPSFSLELVGGSLDDQIKAAAEHYIESEEYEGSVHVHVIEVDGFENNDEVGIVCFSEKCRPETDFWCDTAARNKLFKSRRPEKYETKSS